MALDPGRTPLAGSLLESSVQGVRSTQGVTICSVVVFAIVDQWIPDKLCSFIFFSMKSLFFFFHVPGVDLFLTISIFLGAIVTAVFAVALFFCIRYKVIKQSEAY